jgi:hypothetical protein
MKPMLTAFVAIFVIAFAASYALQNAGFSSQEQNSSPAVRLGDG